MASRMVRDSGLERPAIQRRLPPCRRRAGPAWAGPRACGFARARSGHTPATPIGQHHRPEAFAVERGEIRGHVAQLAAQAVAHHSECAGSVHSGHAAGAYGALAHRVAAGDTDEHRSPATVDVVETPAAGGKDGGRKARRSWPQRLLILFNLLLVVACLTAGIRLTYVERKLGEIQGNHLEKSLKPQLEADEAAKRAHHRHRQRRAAGRGRPRPQESRSGWAARRRDHVLRLDPAQRTGVALVDSRDTYVSIAGTGGENKINSAIFGENGADRLIRTIKQNFGFSIDNYVQLDFQGSRTRRSARRRPDFVNTPIRDRKTGLLVEETGCVTLDPVQALAYARSRHLQYRDPRPTVEDRPDR